MERVVVWLRWIVAARDGADEARAAAMQARAVAARLVAVGGDVLSQLSGTVVATFDPSDMVDAIDAMLDLCDDVDRGESPVRMALGLAMGVLGNDSGVVVGAALDRAQTLASRARDGEIVLAQEARERAAHAFLFARTVTVGAGGPRGAAVDRRHPRREPCRLALRELAEVTVPPAHQALLAELRGAARDGGARVLLRGPYGAGARTLMSALARELTPRLVLDLHAVPGALDPLGSLAAALRLAAARLPADLPAPHAEALRAIAAGESIAHDVALHALTALITHLARAGERVWFLLDPLIGIDPSSVELVAAATAADRAPALVVARLPVGAKPPGVLLEGGAVLDRVLPALRTSDARAIAAGLLGERTDADVIRRVAVLGGDSPAGVVEATRALIAAGELVRSEGAFVWRVAPRVGATSSGLKNLIGERLALLDETAYRVLEAVCLTPEGGTLTIARRVAECDGVDATQWGSAIEALTAEGLLDPISGAPQPIFLVRSVVVEAVQPARASELHRFVAAALRAEDPEQARVFTLASIATHLAEGARPQEASALLLRVAADARTAGFERASVRLAAAAVRFDPREETRLAAATLVADAAAASATATDTPTVHEVPAARSSESVERAVRAIVARDFDAVERLVEAAVAAGGAPAAAERIRAVAQLARGDVESALRTLQRNRRLAPEDTTSARAARASLALALVLLQAGDPVPAVRAAVGALASARARGDTRGEEAALRALASCYRALGRTGDVARLEARVGSGAESR